MAFFRDKVKTYNKKGKEHGWYQTPFIQARDATEESMGELLEKLASLAEEIFRHREDRNATIHEVATKLGKRERELTRQQRQRFDEQQISGFVKETSESEFKDLTVRFTKFKSSIQRISAGPPKKSSRGTKRSFRRVATSLRSRTVCAAEVRGRRASGPNIAVNGTREYAVSGFPLSIVARPLP